VNGPTRRRWLMGAAACSVIPVLAAQRARLPDTDQFDLDAPDGAYRIQVLLPREAPRRQPLGLCHRWRRAMLGKRFSYNPRHGQVLKALDMASQHSREDA